MPEDAPSSARARFARDLRRIREDREMTLAAIHESTQVPQSLLQSFEAGTLSDESRLNPVHLRAFVRGYAEAVGLPPEEVVQHLESALAGEYQNELAVEYLDVPPSVVEEEENTHSGHTAPSIREEKSDEDSSAGDTEPRPSPDLPPEEPPGSTDRSADREDSSSRSMSRGERSRGQGGRTSFWSEYRKELLLAATILVLFGGLWWWYGTGGGGGESTTDPALRSSPSPGQISPDTNHVPTSAADRPPDTTASAKNSVPEDTSEDPQRSPQPSVPDVTLGDTLYVTVLASSDVRGLRVQRDDDLRRPYWIREGEAKVFPFTRRITLENQLDSLRLFLERYPYPSSRTGEEERVVITRETAERFADTLRASPESFSIRPDTMPIGEVPTSDSDTTLEASRRRSVLPLPESGLARPFKPESRFLHSVRKKEKVTVEDRLR